MVLYLLALFFLIPAHSENDNSKTILKQAHKSLFHSFVDGKKCQYSTDKTKLSEVVIYDVKTRVAKNREFEFPKGTRRVAALFDQIVVRGSNLKGVTASFDSQVSGTRLKSMVADSGEFLVLEVIKFPWTNGIIKENPDERGVVEREHEGLEKSNSLLALRIECPNEIVVEEISLRTSRGLLVDIEAFQKNFQSFQNDRIGKLNEEFYWSTMNKSFDELSESLSDPSEAFDRLVYTHTMATTANRSHPIRGFVNDRRVAKIYENLLRMDRSSAAEVASSLFDGAFLKFNASWDKPGVVPNSAKYSVQAHLFLCSEFCSAEEVIAKIDLWEIWHAERSKEKGQFQFKYTAGLDQVYSMNLYMNLIKRDKSLTLDEMNGLLAAKLGPSLQGPPSLTDPSFGKGGNSPPTLRMIDMASSDSTPQQTYPLASIPDIDFASAIRNPVRKSALRKILLDELLSKTDN